MKKLVSLILIAVLLVAAMAPAFAANFTPSVSGKPAPDTVPVPGDNGEEYDAIIGNGGNLVSGVIPGGLIVTPVSKRDEAPNQDISDSLNEAYEQIKNSDSPADLPAGNGGTVGDKIDEVLSDMGSDLKADDLVVRDLFDVSMTDEYENQLTDGNYVEITFDLGLDPDQELIVLQSSDKETWEVLDPSNVVINEDGSVTVRLYKLGVLAFLVDGEAIFLDPSAEDTVASPQTGEF